MTPMTLDELVLSVEETVGSSRARARGRGQRGKAVSVVSVEEVGGRRRSELDF
jgi:hypothetical protein